MAPLFPDCAAMKRGWAVRNILEQDMSARSIARDSWHCSLLLPPETSPRLSAGALAAGEEFAIFLLSLMLSTRGQVIDWFNKDPHLDLESLQFKST